MSLLIWKGGGANVHFWQRWMSDEDRTSRNVTLDLVRGQGKCALLAVVMEPRWQNIKYSQIMSLAEIFSILMTPSSEHPPFKPCTEHLQWSPTQVTAPFFFALQAYVYKTGTCSSATSDQQACERWNQAARQPALPSLSPPRFCQPNRKCRIFWMKKWYRQAAISEVSLLPSFQHVMCPVCQKIFKFTGADLQHSPFENFIPSGLPLSCMLVQGCSLLKQCDLLQFVLCQARWLVDWCSSSSTPSITNIRVSYE